MSDGEPRKPLPIAVLISGTGRTLKNINDRVAGGVLDVDVRLVIASTSKATGVQFAAEADAPSLVLVRRDFDSDGSYSEAIFAACHEAGAELVVLAGWLKLLIVPDDFQNRVVNIHPGLIPSFCGKGYYGHHVHHAAVDYGVKLSGCTVHYSSITSTITAQSFSRRPSPFLIWILLTTSRLASLKRNAKRFPKRSN